MSLRLKPAVRDKLFEVLMSHALSVPGEAIVITLLTANETRRTPTPMFRRWAVDYLRCVDRTEAAARRISSRPNYDPLDVIQTMENNAARVAWMTSCGSSEGAQTYLETLRRQGQRAVNNAMAAV